MPPIYIAIIGAGKIAQDQHIPAINQSNDFQLSCIIDPSVTIKDIPTYPDLDDALAASEKIDAVAICTSPQIRQELAIKALNKGFHVLLEKPPVPNSQDMAQIAALSKDKNRTVFTSWHSRFAPAVQHVKNWIDGRNVGWVKIEWRENVRKWHPGQSWLWQDGGMGVFDPGINALSILTDIFADPFQLSDAELQIPSNQSMPIAANIKLNSANCKIEGDFDFLEAVDEIWQITFSADNGDQLQILQGGHAMMINEEMIDTPVHDEYPALYSHFAELIKSGKNDVDLRPLQLVEEIFRGATRKIVEPFEP